MNNQKSPVILLITDEIPSAHGTGVSKTMYNLFEGYNPEKLIILAEPCEDGKPSWKLKAHLVKEKLRYVPKLGNRIGAYGYNYVVNVLNAWICNYFPLQSLKQVQALKPQVIIVATTLPERIMLAIRLIKNLQLPVIPYFLDNWVTGSDHSYGGKSLQSNVKNILANAAGWMVISENLKIQLENFFGIKAPDDLVIHNPSKIALPRPNLSLNKRPLTIVYAGSLYDMHFDALVLVAKAINRLKANGLRIQLIIYAGADHWIFRQKELGVLGVQYGGFLDPTALMEKLREANLLLVTSSFRADQQHYSACSLQTKVTEYMGSGVPVLSVGPAYGECNRFFNANQCGFVITNNDDREIAALIQNLIYNENEMKKVSLKAVELSATYYSQFQVQQRMHAFIQRSIEHGKADNR